MREWEIKGNKENVFNFIFDTFQIPFSFFAVRWLWKIVSFARFVLHWTSLSSVYVCVLSYVNRKVLDLILGIVLKWKREGEKQERQKKLKAIERRCQKLMWIEAVFQSENIQHLMLWNIHRLFGLVPSLFYCLNIYITHSLV